MHDSVHGLSAKTLSGERYNQFVWWDAEIYQVPVFIFACPQIAKLSLLYRYGQLAQAKENARKQGYKGARYPFVSSVGGLERIWKYTRHPHLQIHITADVGFSVIQYWKNTHDEDFFLRYGFEMLAEIMRYWVSRGEERNGQFVILNVTGTDEHHPYVDNDAYTNYLVRLIFDEALSCYLQYPQLGGYLTREEWDVMRDFADRLYLPMDENGLIPQFDGYFRLSRSLQIEGSGTGKNFQMKQSGLYHLSQVIKQPDVMLLYSYINYPFQTPHYAENWDYYETMCESSSSLSYPVGCCLFKNILWKLSAWISTTCIVVLGRESMQAVPQAGIFRFCGGFSVCESRIAGSFSILRLCCFGKVFRFVLNIAVFRLSAV